MSEWSVSRQEKKKERRARRLPAWEKAADEAFERSGASFMMREALAAQLGGDVGRLSVVVLCGIPGCGKSTLATALKARGFAVVSQDALGSRQKCEQAVSDHVKAGTKVVVDRCNHTHQQRELWLALARAGAPAGRACLVVHVDAPVALCKKRVLSRKHHATLPARQESCAIVERFAKEFEPVAQERAWKIDGAHFKPRDVAAAIDSLGASEAAPPPAAAPARPRPEAVPADAGGGSSPVDRLVAMGWPRPLCEAALLNARGDEAAAVDLLLTKPAGALGL